MESYEILPLFERLQALAFGPKFVEDTPQFRMFVRTARSIFDHTADLLEFEDWEQIKFDPRFPWPGLPKLRSPQKRREWFLRYENQLHDEELSLDDVRTALDFAKKQVGQMFREVALGLMAGDENISSGLAGRVLELQAGFRAIWKPTRRHLVRVWRTRSDHAM